MSKDLVQQSIMHLLNRNNPKFGHGKRFYGYFLLSMRKHYDVAGIPTAAVNITNQINLYINTEFFKSLTPIQRIEVLEHECISGNNLIETNKGLIKISDIVNKQLDVKVKSLSKDGKIEYKPITEYSKKRMKDCPDKKWVSIKYSTNNYLYKTLVCTNDHRIAYTKDPLNIKIDYIEAEKSKGLYSVRKVDNNKKLNKERAAYNSEQLQAIIGCLLGDASIGKAGILHHSGSLLHEGYTNYKKQILGGDIKKAYSGYNESYTNLRLDCGTNDQQKYLRDLMYINGKKTVKNIIDHITPISLAFWYMDDGSNNGYNSTFFHTEGFSNEDQLLLVKMLKDKFDIESELYPRSHKKHLTCIKLKKEATSKLFDLISPYIHSSMIHKVHKDFKDKIGTYVINNKHLDYSLKRIEDVKDRPSLKSKLYDIGVKDNSNFFANNTLVHNCKHIISYHQKRFKKLDEHDMKLWNIACDAAINAPLTSLHEFGVTVEKLRNMVPNLEDNQTSEYYFAKLKEYRDKNGGKGGQGEKDLTGDGNGQGGKGGDLVDDHSAWGKSEDLEKEADTENSQGHIDEIQKQIVKKAMQDAVDKCDGRGNVPIEIIQALDKLNAATVNWKQQLKQFFAKADKFSKEATRKKLNRRYKHLNPGRRKKPQTHIAIGVDESGSVCNALHKQFFSEIDAAARLDGIKFTIINADCQVNKVFEYEPGMKIERTGMGGTEYMPAINKANDLKVDGMIYFGDGDIFGEKLTKPKFPFLWAMEDGRNAPAEWGRVCHVKLPKGGQ